jgi:hypothetical protein
METVRVYDFETKQVVTIPTAELVPRGHHHIPALAQMRAALALARASAGAASSRDFTRRTANVRPSSEL